MINLDKFAPLVWRCRFCTLIPLNSEVYSAYSLEYCGWNGSTEMWNQRGPPLRFQSGGWLKKRLRSILFLGGVLVAVCSVFVHPFGAIKAQRSNKPLLLDSTFDSQVVRTLEKSCQNCHSEKTE